MGRRHLFLFIVATCPWLLCAFSSPQAPARGEWFTFSATASGTRTVGSSHTVFDGVSQIYSLRLPAGRVPPRRAWLRTPANFHESDLHGPRHRPRPDDPDPYSRYFLLVDALRHFRPETRLQRNEAGDWRVVPTRRTSAYQVCVRDRIDEAVDRIHGRSRSERQESEQEGRAIWARAADPPMLAAINMLNVLRQLPSFIYGEQRRPAEPASEQQVTGSIHDQLGWRSAAISAHGRDFLFQTDLLADPQSPAAAICRPANEPARSGIIEARCTVHGVLDQRDGWPIQMRIMRIVRTSAGEEFGDEVYHWRLAPLEDFVAPANPCTSNDSPAG